MVIYHVSWNILYEHIMEDDHTTLTPFSYVICVLFFSRKSFYDTELMSVYQVAISWISYQLDFCFFHMFTANFHHRDGFCYFATQWRLLENKNGGTASIKA